MYNININRLGHDSLEQHRRKPKFLAMLYVMLSPFVSIYGSFMAFRETINYELAITAQVSSLEYHINKVYGLPYVLVDRDALIAAGSIIYFEDTSNMPFTWVGKTAPFYVGDTANASVAGLSAYELHNHYIVKVPNAVAYNSTVLRAEINRFNHVNRKFTIQNY